ncbi:MAG TPA: YciI family protein [Candidatus Cybelea sp.]|nr:YciI family protein [Candidatus Cybelea sp.]
MRFMMIVKASKDSEAGKMPDPALIAQMTKFNEELAKAGVLVDLNGLQASSKGVRVVHSGGKRTVVEGPFKNTEELIAGYWLINVKSKQEAIEWAMRAPPPHGPDKESAIELRQVFELEDFPPSEAIDDARKFGEKIGKTK